MGSKAFENPLIPHARMRQLYRALVEARVLGEGSTRRKSVAGSWPRNLEACWVATAIDLKPGDLTSVDGSRWLLDHVRSLGQRAGQAASRGEMTRALEAKGSAAPRALPGLDRALCAAGMAQALKVSNAGIAVCHLTAGELSAADWKRLLAVAGQGDLPLIVVIVPASGAQAAVDVPAIAKKLSVNVPVIPVDAGDVVALYRVAQETAVRARSDGGLAVIEGIACGTDPVALLGRQLIQKKICTERWVSAVEPGVRRVLGEVRR